jgi:diaminopimelate epimerase
MDYRNADGSIAEMCGNGIRVFVRWLVDEGLAGSVVPVSTRGGTLVVSDAGDGLLRVDMGVVDVAPADAASVRVATTGGSWEATAAYAPNPHAVAFLDNSDLDAVGPLSTPPVVTPADAFPDGVNVEFVVDRGPRHVAMRVHERGSGETRSCGTGVCAVAAVAARRAGDTGPSSWTVDVPGGRLSVDLDGAGGAALTGPAVIVAVGELDDAWMKGNS